LYETFLKLPVVMLIENYNIKNAHKIVVVSKALKEVLKNFGINDDKIIVIPNGVDELKYCPDLENSDIREEYGLKDKIIIGFIGTFGHWHGAENIALAYGRLIQKYPEYKEKTSLFMIGDGIKMNEVKNHIKNFNIFENVILTGLVSQKEGPKYLSICDILVNSTVPNPDGTEFFGSPTKIFEYMAMGKGIICSDMGQMSEILEHEKTALMVKPGDIEDLLESMKILIDNESLRKEIGKNARKSVMEKYTWDKHVDQILSNIV
jgi:glycosyltransferase involved in cell wall biosynthesis